MQRRRRTTPKPANAPQSSAGVLLQLCVVVRFAWRAQVWSRSYMGHIAIDALTSFVRCLCNDSLQASFDVPPVATRSGDSVFVHDRHAAHNGAHRPTFQ